MVNEPTNWVLASGGKGRAKYTAIGLDPNMDVAVTVPFGDDRYSDYTRHKDKKRMEKYLTRHRARENWHDLFTAGAWSRWILWHLPDLGEAIDAMEDRFNINIVFVGG